jgi:hypothetical protein
LIKTISVAGVGALFFPLDGLYGEDFAQFYWQLCGFFNQSSKQLPPYL